MNPTWLKTIGSLTADQELAILTALQAGEAIMKFYARESGAQSKADGSPITWADQAAHELIARALGTTDHAVVSEEADALHLDQQNYWLVDPLDGTKDFLAANGEFTVNIACIQNGRPSFGIVYGPAVDELYIGISGQGSWRVQGGLVKKAGPAARSARTKMATSRFHDSDDAAEFAKEHRITDFVAVGSALKFGRLAFGEVDVYPRLVGTSEWDTAAGQAVLEAAGGHVLDWKTGEPLTYGKPRRRNGRFLAFREGYQAKEFRRRDFEMDLK